uniref:Uncharacterized protein n=1 Tax=Anopheles culicifacies TaxID=139723 RepID=A0A182LZC3_9DIPT
MALTDGRRPTKETHAWTAWPWSTAREALRVTPNAASSFTPFVSSTSTATTTITSYTALPPKVSSPAAFHSTSSNSRAPFSSTISPGVRSQARLTTVVDQLSSLVSSTVTGDDADDDGTDGDLSTPVSSSYGTGSTPGSSFPTEPTTIQPAGNVRNLTQTFLSNYTTVATEYAGDISNGSSFSSSPSSTLAEDRGSTIPGLSLSLPDLLEEDELMALWNCTNCFLLNYGTAGGGVNGTGKYYGNGTVDPRDVLLLPKDDDDLFASETTIYLIRVIATAIVLGIVILATVIGSRAMSSSLVTAGGSGKRRTE